jgi:hypothetical protein
VASANQWRISAKAIISQQYLALAAAISEWLFCQREISSLRPVIVAENDG